MPTLQGRFVGGSTACACGHQYAEHSDMLLGPCHHWGDLSCGCPHFSWPAMVLWPQGVYPNGLPRRTLCSTCSMESGAHSYDAPYSMAAVNCPGFSHPLYTPGAGVAVAAVFVPPEPAFDFAAAVVEGAEDEELRKALDALEPL